MFDRPAEGLPRLADDLFIGGDCALGRHAQRVGLDTHVGRELPLALGGTIVSDRTVEVLVTSVIRRLGRCVARLCDGPGVELPGAMSRSEEHTSELQSLMRISYAVFRLKKKTMET